MWKPRLISPLLPSPLLHLTLLLTTLIGDGMEIWNGKDLNWKRQVVTARVDPERSVVTSGMVLGAVQKLCHFILKTTQ